MTTAYGCDQCNLMMIQGVRCHEHGCPDAWQDDTRQCSWCGTEFQPQTRRQAFDDDSCYAAYNNI
jgi:hypothetical protein